MALGKPEKLRHISKAPHKWKSRQIFIQSLTNKMDIAHRLRSPANSHPAQPVQYDVQGFPRGKLRAARKKKVEQRGKRASPSAVSTRPSRLAQG